MVTDGPTTNGPADGPTGHGAAGPGPIYSTRAKVAIAAVLALAGVAFGLAFALSSSGVDDEPIAIRGEDRTSPTGNAPLDGFRLRPAQGTQALRQAEIGVDLQPGWEGTLVVDGVEIPHDQLRTVEAENQVFFTPGEGRAVERLPGGENCVTAIAWRTQDGRGIDDHRLTWCFNVL